jgi:predicted GNAT family acetyltransferase
VVAEVSVGDGAVVSSARLARWGRYGIIDQVETVPGFRHRGLATAVMATLGNWAVGHGVCTGLLSATDDGAVLYRRLGWTALGEIAGAVRSH